MNILGNWLIDTAPKWCGHTDTWVPVTRPAAAFWNTRHATAVLSYYQTTIKWLYS